MIWLWIIGILLTFVASLTMAMRGAPDIKCEKARYSKDLKPKRELINLK